MFYWLYLTFASSGYVPILNLLKYQTFRTGLAIFTAQLVVVALGSRFIRWMKARQGKGQPIRAEGIERHVIEKAGTPTMGGVMILAGLFAGTLLWADLSNVYVWAVLIVTGGYGLLGFLDDYSKVTKQTTAGISGRVRLVLEAGIAMAAIALIILFAAKPPESPELLTAVTFPIFKQLFLDLSWGYLFFGAFVIVGAANAVNFTDGLDGLATVPVMIAAAAYGLIAYIVGNYVFSNYLQLHFVPGVGELAVFCGALIGSGLGFLWYNAPPAKIFMGDTGSLALGGALGTIAVATRHEIVLAIIGGLFVAELLSVVVQVTSFRLTGKRVFRMAPVHHHFEKLGWSESTVVIRFWIVAVMLALVGLATLKLR
ncbi:phospho-N-acetylmuramoyl-pentapeptide-transferase [Phenylobacterium sp.]|uniref:phospho-N-acetylmuramoyl-pentapeptide- transferase n=1 Tax=Phenylobacterium sp. TaxID=1871053 RepID=UPI0025DB2D9D|nr:phospho-N-acetylmuramoyl-pentapeptide-transferase [Phenylobacterium sp.]